jgi:8-hydroxy-5-deazaflavin:NADPH oxidoreductase
MDIGIIGSGKIGGTVARLAARAGHNVTVANSRGPDSLAGLVGELGPNARAATVDEAVRAGDVVVLAIPLHAVDDLPADPFDGRIVVDANNYYPQRDGNVAELDSGATTSSELVARHLPGARVVKAFNTIYFENLGTDGRPGAPREERVALLLAGDDADAKATVAGLIEELGFGAVDTGTLAAGSRRQQVGAPLYGAVVTVPEAEAALAAA